MNTVPRHPLRLLASVAGINSRHSGSRRPAWVRLVVEPCECRVVPAVLSTANVPAFLTGELPGNTAVEFRITTLKAAADDIGREILEQIHLIAVPTSGGPRQIVPGVFTNIVGRGTAERFVGGGTFDTPVRYEARASTHNPFATDDESVLASLIAGTFGGTLLGQYDVTAAQVGTSPPPTPPARPKKTLGHIAGFVNARRILATEFVALQNSRDLLRQQLREIKITGGRFVEDGIVGRSGATNNPVVITKELLPLDGIGSERLGYVASDAIGVKLYQHHLADAAFEIQTGDRFRLVSKSLDTLNRLINDPPDPNFTTVAPPVDEPFTPTPAMPGEPAAVIDALNASTQNLARFAGLGQAALTAMERSAGAELAGDTAAEALQMAALRDYLARMADVFDRQADLYLAEVAAIRAAGVGLRVTAEDVAADQRALAVDGIDPDLRDAALAAGLTPAEIDRVTAGVIALDPAIIAAEFPNPTFPQLFAGLYREAAADIHSASPASVGSAEFVVGIGAGGGPIYSAYNPDGSERPIFPILADGFFDDIRTAAADFNGDGVADFVVGTGPGSATRVRVLDGVTEEYLFDLAPFEASFEGGVFVAAGDLDGDGTPDLVITPDEGGGPRVDVYSGNGFGKMASFFGIDDPNFRGGARAAVGDLNGDGTGDLLVSAGFGGGPRVAGFNGRSIGGSPARLFGDFFAFEDGLRNGVYLAAGDLDGDGYAELVAGGGPGGGPRVTAFGGKALLGNQLDVRANFFGGDTASRGGVRVAVKNLDGDRRADLVVGAGEEAGSRVTAYFGKNIGPSGLPPEAFAFDAFEEFPNGVFVG